MCFLYININEHKYSTNLLSRKRKFDTKAKEYYENNKDRLSNQARDIYNNLPEE